MDTGEALSVIMPSRGEGSLLVEAVRAARLALGESEFVVVAFGESADIRERACAEGVTWVNAPRANRGLQLKLGAERTRGRHLVFLHVDSRLPAGAGRLIHRSLAVEGAAGGAFRLRFDRAHPVLDLLSWMSGMTLPSAFLGDQCLFCTRGAYNAAGGFREDPLFEDVGLARRLARCGRLVRLHEAVTTSARRFMSNGPFRQLATNAILTIAFHAGVRPERLVGWYEPGSSVRPRPAPSLHTRRPRRVAR